MDVSPQVVGAVPGAQLGSLDPSVAPDSGIASNTVVPSYTRVLNPSAIALDNPAGTGAAFDKKQSIYNVYQRWNEKSTTINGSVSAGAELVRISLNPMTLPQRLREWCLFHRSCIPSIDVGILIGGAAGTISWLAVGWIPDDQQPVTLDELQQVSCEHINMNTTIVSRYILNDNRRMGMYRKLPFDDEPWPAMVILVNHPALNVQRNNDVNYPVDIFVRFAPGAQFFEPFNTIAGGSEFETRIDLSSYLKANTVDILIGASNVCNPLADFLELEDAGWNSGNFVPSFTEDHFMTARCDAIWQDLHSVVFGPVGSKPDFPAIKEKFMGNNTAQVPMGLIYAWGIVPKNLYRSPYAHNQAVPQYGWTGTSYQIPPFQISFGGIIYTSRSMMVWEFGCAMLFSIENRTDDTATKIIYYAAVPDNTNFSPIGVIQNPAFGTSDIGLWNPSNKSVSRARIQYVQQINQGGSYPLPYDLAQVPTVVNRFYEWTYVQSSNNASSSALPSGLRTISIVRTGTTSTVIGDNPFFPILAPDVRGAKSILNDLCDKLSSQWLAFEVTVDGIAIGTAVYSDSVMAVRSPSPRQIRVGMPKRIVATNIRAIDQPSAIPNFNVTGFVDWTEKKAYSGERPRFSLMHMQRQSGVGFALAGGASALNGIFDYFKTQEQRGWMDKYQKTQLDAQKALSDNLQFLKNQGQLDLAQKNFDNQMLLLGKNSVSSQAGNNEIVNIGTQTTNKMTPSVPERPSTSIRTPLEPHQSSRVPTPFKQAGYDPNQLSTVSEGDPNPLQKVEELEQMWKPSGDSQGEPGKQQQQSPAPLGPSPGYISFPQGGFPPPAPSELMGNRSNAVPGSMPDSQMRMFMDYYNLVPREQPSQFKTTTAPENIGPSINAGGVSSFKSAGPVNHAAHKIPFNEGITSFSHEPAAPSHPYVPNPELDKFSSIPRAKVDNRLDQFESLPRVTLAPKVQSSLSSSSAPLNNGPSIQAGGISSFKSAGPVNHAAYRAPFHEGRTNFNQVFASPLVSAPMDASVLQSGLPIPSASNTVLGSSNELTTRF
jgi:hypothetical protein